MFKLKIILLAIVTFIASLNFQVMSVEAVALPKPLIVETMDTSKLFPVTLISQSPSSPTNAEKIAFRRQAIRKMKEQIDQTLSLVKSGNYQQAQTPFSTARKTWFTFGGTIKRIAPDVYETMNPGFNQANTLLNQSNPQKQALIDQLQTLSNTGTKAVKVSDAKK